MLAFPLLLFEAAKSEARVVNVDFVQLACSRKAWRSVAAGATFALLTFFKPNVAAIGGPRRRGNRDGGPRRANSFAVTCL